MVKYILIIINALVALIFGWFNGDGNITITGNFPKSMKPGTEAVVELTIKKGSLGGFAKLQLELPEGVTVKEIDNKGASFTAGPGLAKWIWTSLPSDAEMIVKFNLAADASSNGTKTIGGKFSYIENNAKQIAEMTPAEVVVSTDAAINTTTSVITESTTPTQTSSTEPVAATNTVASTPTTETKTANNGEPLGNINAVRKITPINANQFQVDVKIKKDGTKGFARFSDNLPEGFTAKQVKTDGSSFSVADGKIKFVWVTVPAVDELNISYLLTGTNTKATTLSGEYSYLEDNQSKKIKLSDSDLPATSESVATTTVNTTTEKSSDNSNTTNITKTENTSPAPTATTITSTEKNTSNSSTENPPTNKTESTLTENLNKKDGSVNYAVQVGAFTNGNVTASVLAGKFKIKEKIRSEMASGFNKFMVGNFGEYKAARDHRETVKSNNGVASAFVVAYNGGRRITVQEALTITNQKWFK